MRKQQKNNEIKTYGKIFLITWMIFFILENLLHALQFSSLTALLLAGSGMAAFAAGIFAVLLYDIITASDEECTERFEFVDIKHKKHIRMGIRLPEKATASSVGYDFFSPEECIIFPGEKHMFWTDVKVRLRKDEALVISPRSSAGIKKSLMLANTIGTIDPDYYGNEDNDGNIGICLFNYGAESVQILKEDRFAQGVIFKVVNDVVANSNKRKGGIGSTGK